MHTISETSFQLQLSLSSFSCSVFIANNIVPVWALSIHSLQFDISVLIFWMTVVLRMERTGYVKRYKVQSLWLLFAPKVFAFQQWSDSYKSEQLFLVPSWKYNPSTHPSIFFSFSISGLQLGWSHRPTTCRQPFKGIMQVTMLMLTLTRMSNLEWPHIWTVAGSWSTKRKHTHTQEKTLHTDRPWLDSNSELSNRLFSAFSVEGAWSST